MKIILISVLALIVLVSSALSQANPPESQFFEFYLYYDQGSLSLDNETITPYDIVSSSENQTSEPGSAVGKVVSIDGREVEFSYSLVQGKNIIHGPYLDQASYVSFGDAKGDKLLVVSVREGEMLCDYDKICSRAIGESATSCPNDCQESTLLPLTSVSPSVTPPELPEGGGFTPFIFIGAFVLVGIIVAFFMFRSRNTSV